VPVLKQKKESKIKKQSIQKAEASKIDVKVQNIPIKKTKTKKVIPLKLKKKNSRTGKEQNKEDFKTDSYSRASLKQRGS